MESKLRYFIYFYQEVINGSIKSSGVYGEYEEIMPSYRSVAYNIADGDGMSVENINITSFIDVSKEDFKSFFDE